MAVLVGADDASAEAPEWGGGRGLGRDLGENRRRQLILPSGALLPSVPVYMCDLQGRKLSLCAQKKGGDSVHPIGSTTGNATSGGRPGNCGRQTPNFGTPEVDSWAR
jgi:hypothetical protein